MNTENGHKFNFNKDKCEYCGKVRESYEDSKNKSRCMGKKNNYLKICFNKKFI